MNYHAHNFVILPRLLLVVMLTVALSGCFNVPPPGESHYNKGVDLYDENKYAEAIEEYKLELRQNPDNQFARYNLAVVYHDLENDVEAEKLYREILNATEDTNSRINLSSIYFSRGDEDLAFKELETAAKNNPDSPKPLSVLGEFQERKQMNAEARENYLKALRIDDQHSISHYRLGRLDLSEGKHDSAILSLKKATEIETEIPMFYETLADAYVEAGKFSLAIDMLERASTLEPDRADLFVRLGDLYKGQGEYDKAVKRYWEAVGIKDDNPQVHLSLKEIFDILAKQETERLNQIKPGSAVAQSKERP